jgi:hypothetical protein
MALDITEIKIRDKVTIAGTEITSVETTLTGGNSALPRADAVKAYVDSLLNANDAMQFKGTIGTGGTVTALPTTHSAGWTYRVITAATYAGVVTEVGDLIIAVIDRAGTGNANSDWTVVQTNIDGAVIGPSSSTSGNISTFNGTSGKLIQDSGVSFETTLTTNSDTKSPTSKAVATYVTGLGYTTNTGTVTSVGLALPNIFSVSDSPVTTSGTLTGTLANQNANIVFAGPGTGSAAAPTFRALVANDIPNLDAEKITTGTLPISRGGTGATSVTQGGIIYGSSTSAYASTAVGTAGQVLTSNGTAAPTWSTISGTGTVTSVGLAMPTGFTVTNSPVTTTGTLTAALSSGYSLLDSNSAQTIAGSKTFSSALTIQGDLLINNPSVYGRINGHDTYHSIVLRGNISGTSTQTVVPNDSMTFAEYGGIFRFKELTPSANTDLMTLTPTGLGIGTTSTITKLQVHGSAWVGNEGSGVAGSQTGALYLGGTFNSNQLWYSASIRVTNTDSVPSTWKPRLGFFTQNTGEHLNTNQTERLSIRSDSGNVGIGNTSPDHRLVVGGVADTRVQVDSSSTQGIYFTKSGTNNGTFRTSADGDFEFFTKSVNQALVLKAGGNVGIGTTNPLSKLHVQGDITGQNTSGFSSIYRQGGIYFTWDAPNYGTNPEHSIRSTYGDNYGDHITLNSFGNIRMNIDSNNNGTNNFEIGFHTTGTGNILFQVTDTGDTNINSNLTVTGGTNLINKNNPAMSNISYLAGNNHIELRTTNGSNPILGFHRSGFTAVALYHDANNSLRLRDANTGADSLMWHSSNQGASGRRYLSTGTQTFGNGTTGTYVSSSSNTVLLPPNKVYKISFIGTQTKGMGGSTSCSVGLSCAITGGTNPIVRGKLYIKDIATTNADERTAPLNATTTAGNTGNFVETTSNLSTHINMPCGMEAILYTGTTGNVTVTMAFRNTAGTGSGFNIVVGAYSALIVDELI